LDLLRVVAVKATAVNALVYVPSYFAIKINLYIYLL